MVLLLVAAAAFAGFALPPHVPLEVMAAGVAVPVTMAVDRQGHLELSLFLVVTATLYAAWHLGSTLRAAAVALVSSALIWWAAQRTAEDFSWEPWVTAEVFMLVLGRTLCRQRVRSPSWRRRARHWRRGRWPKSASTSPVSCTIWPVTRWRRCCCTSRAPRHVLRRDVDDAEQALCEAERVGRSSMDQIRDTVAALRTTERGTDPPLPAASDLTDLGDEYRRAGLTVEARIAPEVSRLGGSTAVTLHRLTREALADVARHAPANHVTICAAADTESVYLRIGDHGRRPPPPAPGRPGFGAAGMQERALSLGGTLVARPTADGWAVDVTVPLPNPKASTT